MRRELVIKCRCRCAKQCMDNYLMSLWCCNIHNYIKWHHDDSLRHPSDVPHDVADSRCPNTWSYMSFRWLDNHNNVICHGIVTSWRQLDILCDGADTMCPNLGSHIHAQPGSVTTIVSFRCFVFHNDIIWHRMDTSWCHLNIPRDVADVMCPNLESWLTAQPDCLIMHLRPTDFILSWIAR